MSSNDEKSYASLITSFQFVDFITDLCTGVLMISLFGPLFYAAHYGFSQGTLRQLLFRIFPDFFLSFNGLSMASIGPWLLGTLALVLGFVSRGVLVIHNLLPLSKKVERCLTKIACWQLKKWHGLAGGWDDVRVVKELISRNPFHEAGDPNYASYRASLEEPKSQLKPSKPYWDYEALVFIRASHIYGIFLTFSFTYLLYGIVVSVVKGLHFPESVLWISLVMLSFSVTICLLEEVIIHGVAFIAIDEVLRRRSSTG